MNNANLHIGQTLSFKVNNFYTGWKDIILKGTLRAFHCPGWVTIWVESEKANYYIQYKEIIAIVK